MSFIRAAKPRFVAGSMGPTTKAITVTGGVTFEGLRETLLHAGEGFGRRRRRICCWWRLARTRGTSRRRCWRLRSCRKKLAAQMPMIVSVTIEPMGTMLAGQTVEAMWASLRHAKPLAFGMNCATGPEFMTDHIRTLSRFDRRVCVVLSERGIAG